MNPAIASALSFKGFLSFSLGAKLCVPGFDGRRKFRRWPSTLRQSRSLLITVSRFDNQGLIARAAARSDEIVLQIDLEDGDSGLDQEVGSLCGQVHQLRNVAQEIDREGKFQNDMLNQLQSTLIKARAGVKNNVRGLHKSLVQYGSNNVIPIIVFALICFFLVYLWYKISG